MKLIRPPVFGLVLSGGAARGLAHIGVLKVLERDNIQIDCLAGTSMGGMVAAFFAAGRTAEELEQEALRMGRVKEMLKLVDFLAAQRAMLSGEKVRSYLIRQLGKDLTFADLRIPTADEADWLLSPR